jgi:mRNA interferase MazF
MPTVSTPRRGEIWLIDFDPAVGAEIGKSRPAVVISVDAVGRLPLKIVVPLTDWRAAFSAFPWMVSIVPTPQNGLHKHSGADAFQTKSNSEARFVRRIGVTRPTKQTKSRKQSPCAWARLDLLRYSAAGGRSGG